MKRMMCVRLGWVTFELVTWPGTPYARGMSRPFLTSFSQGLPLCVQSPFQISTTGFMRIDPFEPMAFYSWSRAAAPSPPFSHSSVFYCYLYILFMLITDLESAFSASSELINSITNRKSYGVNFHSARNSKVSETLPNRCGCTFVYIFVLLCNNRTVKLKT